MILKKTDDRGSGHRENRVFAELRLQGIYQRFLHGAKLGLMAANLMLLHLIEHEAAC